MNIKEIIQKKRERDGANIDWRALAEAIAKEVAEQKLAGIRDEARAQFAIVIDELTRDLTPEKLKGDEGKKPVAGVDYRVPKDGKPGDDGHTPTRKELLALIDEVMPEVENGKDGKTPTSSQLLKLIKPLIPTKEKILALIRPLMEAFETKFNRKLEELRISLQKRSRERGGGSGGGGMGAIVTQSTSISSATTTISLDYNVASNGKAIWFNYQGQQQAYGTHFTVSGKTITLLFTPSDSTFADIIYIRR